jgi:NTP pyrophosphatase (non-canonical NTP hydrolase)
MADTDTTIAQLRQLVNDFVERRQWHQFHTPKNLAMSLAIEAAELMEHSQWLTAEQSRQLAATPDKRSQIGEEMADVLAYLLAMANELGLDVSTALRDKIAKNERKYPAEQYRGLFGPNDPNAA